MSKVPDKKKEARWGRLLRERRRTGESVADFCTRRGVPVHQFYWWQRRLRAVVAVDAPQSRHAADFVPVRFALPGAGPIEVMHRDGHLIRLPIGFDPVSLGHLLQALETRSAAAEA
jgi:hypothetical protein